MFNNEDIRRNDIVVLKEEFCECKCSCIKAGRIVRVIKEPDSSGDIRIKLYISGGYHRIPVKNVRKAESEEEQKQFEVKFNKATRYEHATI